MAADMIAQGRASQNLGSSGGCLRSLDTMMAGRRYRHDLRQHPTHVPGHSIALTGVHFQITEPSSRHPSSDPSGRKHQTSKHKHVSASLARRLG
jgi:hypothetical protein